MNGFMMDGENPFFPLIPSENEPSSGNFFGKASFNELEKNPISVRINPNETFCLCCLCCLRSVDEWGR